jgi:hypothetical protein
MGTKEFFGNLMRTKGSIWEQWEVDDNKRILMGY